MARTVVVTGGGTGIGRAIASAFRSAGDTVVITGRRAQPLRDTAAELGPGVRARTCDGVDPGAVAEFAAGLERVDVLVNNAGGNTDFDRAEPVDLEALAASWRANLEANLLSAVLMTEAIRPKLARGGSIVNLGSIAADTGSGSYGAAKAGLASWNISLAARLGPLGVTANVVSPGYIGRTEFFRDRLTEQRRDTLIAATSTGRAGTPEDVADTVVFLASAAARHITGQTLAVNGGAHPTR
jgi:3-oxoacyl-[acyl-carrier protein] reductase